MGWDARLDIKEWMSGEPVFFHISFWLRTNYDTPACFKHLSLSSPHPHIFYPQTVPPDQPSLSCHSVEYSCYCNKKCDQHSQHVGILFRWTKGEGYGSMECVDPGCNAVKWQPITSATLAQSALSPFHPQVSRKSVADQCYTLSFLF